MSSNNQLSNIKELENRVRECERRLGEALSLLARAHNDYSRLRNSTQYQIGTIIANSLNSFRDAIATPFRLWRLYRKRSFERGGTGRVSMQPAQIATSKVASKIGDTDSILPVKVAGGRLRIIFMATNGAGLGHLTRALAIARRIKSLPRVESIAFLTTSAALNIIQKEGFASYYLPPFQPARYQHTFGGWNKYLHDYLKEMLKLHNANLLVFDGNYPYKGLRQVIAQQKDLSKIWVRRQTFKPGIENRLTPFEPLFDTIIIPGECNNFSVDVSVSGKRQKITTTPIVYLEKEEMLEKQVVCDRFGLDPSNRNVLLQLGAGNINDIQSISRIILDILSHYPNVESVLAESIIANTSGFDKAGIKIIREYPLARFYPGFDFVISAAGYNSVNELAYYGIPAIFLPNEQATADDQKARAQLAGMRGYPIWTTPYDVDVLKRAIAQLMTDNGSLKGTGQSYRNGADTLIRLFA